MKIPIVVILLILSLSASNAQSTAQIDALMLQSIQNQTFPGAVVLVGNHTNVFFQKAYGNYTYQYQSIDPELNQPMQLDTMFDMASCSKVLVTTTCLAQFYQRGEVDLDDTISSEKLLGSAFAANGKSSITIRNCLMHNAGYPPDPVPNYWDASFGCPQYSNTSAVDQTFVCRGKIYESLLNQTLINPVGALFLYSDLSFITLMNVVGKLAMDLQYVTADELNQTCATQGPQEGIYQCYFEAYAEKHLFQALNLTRSGYRPAESVRSECAVEENYTNQFPGKIMQGEVSDQNAYISGGIQGHAGFFTTAEEAWKIASCWLAPCPDTLTINQTTIDLWSTRQNATQSTRALGWDTNNVQTPYYQNTGPCGNMSTLTFEHLGYTGTQVCIDKENEIISVVLTNRVWPTDDGTNEKKINTVRPFINSALLNLGKEIRSQQQSVTQQA